MVVVGGVGGRLSTSLSSREIPRGEMHACGFMIAMPGRTTSVNAHKISRSEDGQPDAVAGGLRIEGSYPGDTAPLVTALACRLPRPACKQDCLLPPKRRARLLNFGFFFECNKARGDGLLAQPIRPSSSPACVLLNTATFSDWLCKQTISAGNFYLTAPSIYPAKPLPPS